MIDLIRNTLLLTIVGQGLCLVAFGGFQPTTPAWAWVSSEREADVYCDSDAACSDSVSATDDYCLIGGECAHVPGCAVAQDCTGGQTGAWVSCYQSKCFWYCNPSICPVGDVNTDGKVDAADLADLLHAWGPKTDFWPCDLDGDMDVDPADLAELLNSWRVQNGQEIANTQQIGLTGNNVPPHPEVNYFADCCLVNSVSCGKVHLSVTTDNLVSDFGNHFLCELGVVSLFSVLEKTVLKGMAHILKTSNVFQVAKSVIVLDAVFVVDFQLARSDKRSHHQPVYPVCTGVVFHAQVNRGISFGLPCFENQPRRRAVPCAVSPNPSQTGNTVPSFVTNHRTPFFGKMFSRHADLRKRFSCSGSRAAPTARRPAYFTTSGGGVQPRFYCVPA